MTAEAPAAAPTPAEWGTARSRPVSWHDPMITAAGALERSGLETMEAIRDGLLPPVPIATLMQFDIRALEEGRVGFGCTPDDPFSNRTAVLPAGRSCPLSARWLGGRGPPPLPAGV